MTLEREEVINVAERAKGLAVESTETVVDSAYLIHRQGIQLTEAALKVLDANHAASRDLAVRLVRQTQEMQMLWWRTVQDTIEFQMDTLLQMRQYGLSNGGKEATTTTKRETPAGRSTVAART